MCPGRRRCPIRRERRPRAAVVEPALPPQPQPPPLPHRPRPPRTPPQAHRRRLATTTRLSRHRHRVAARLLSPRLARQARTAARTRQRTSKRVFDQTRRARERLGRWGGGIAHRQQRMPPFSGRPQIGLLGAVCRGPSGPEQARSRLRRAFPPQLWNAGTLLVGGRGFEPL
jgi:hypothetical protein